MAEQNADRMSGLFSALASNPALLRSAMSLLGGLDPGAMLRSASAPTTEAEASAGNGEGPDLAAILASITGKNNNQDGGEGKSGPSEAPASPPVSHRENARHSGRRNTELLLALRPFLNEDRRTMIDRIVQITRMMDAFVSADPPKP